MSHLNDKLNNTKDKVLGEVKETLGKVTGNESLELKGKIQSLKSSINEKNEAMLDDVAEKINNFIDEKKDKKK